MAYEVPWNESSPVGATTPADTIDTEIQNLKKSIRERLEDLIPDWANDGVDPKTLTFTVGTEVARPATPTNNGEVYYTTDTGVLFIASGGAWVTYGLVIDALADKPANPGYETLLFIANDTGEVFVPDDSGNWQVIGVVVKDLVDRDANPEGPNHVFIAKDTGVIYINDEATPTKNWIRVQLEVGLNANKPATPETKTHTYIAYDKKTISVNNGSDVWVDIFNVQVDTEANLPATPANDNSLFISNDTGATYIAVSGAWEKIGVHADTFAQRPASPDNFDHMFFAIDREQLFVGGGANWEAVSPFVSAIANLPASPEGKGDLFISTDDHQVYINDGAGAWEFLTPAKYVVKVIRTTTQSIPDDIATEIQWSAASFEYFDADQFDPVISTRNLVVPVSGVYLVVLNVFWDPTGQSGYRACSIRSGILTLAASAIGDRNESLSNYVASNPTIDRSYDCDATSVAELADVLATLIADLGKILGVDRQSVTAIHEFTAGDTIQGYVHQQTGGVLDIEGPATPTNMAMVLLTPAEV